MALFNVTHEHRTTINENKAPTDESIRLYHELLEKARSEVLGYIDSGSNRFEGELVHVQFSPKFQQELIAVFKLNGQRYVVKTEMDPLLPITQPNLEERRYIIAAELAKAIAIQLMSLLPPDRK